MKTAYAILGLLFVLLIVGVVVGTRGGGEETETITQSNQKGTMETFTLTSSAFEHNGKVPPKYTCDAENINPPLAIAGVPDGTQSLALIMDDPDIPESVKEARGIDVFVHWVVFNMSPTVTIQEGLEPTGAAGQNTRGETGYTGPCPPDAEHRYLFKLYALDAALELADGATKEEVEQAMQRHIIAQTELIGLYERQQ